MSDTFKIRKVQADAKLSIGGVKYRITDVLDDGTSQIPLVDIPVMSDERWNEIARSPENQARLHPVNPMADLIDEYEQKINVIAGLLERYKAALEDARAKKRNIEAARIHRKIEIMKVERFDLEAAIRGMKKR